jgi:hypothetical protein
MKKIRLLLLSLLLLSAHNLLAAETHGTLTANGHKAEMKYVIAYETDSTTEPGYLDVVVVISDHKLSESVARNQEKLEEMAHNKQLAGLRVVLNPDARVMSAEPLHSSFKNFVSSALWIKWKPQAFDDKQVAGRFFTDNMQEEFSQKWQYDITFSTPIILDPQAKTAPGN